MPDPAVPRKKFKDYFATPLAHWFAHHIQPIYPEFDSPQFIKAISVVIERQTMKQRVESFADALFHHLPKDYHQATDILSQLLGPENPEETGMYTQYYYLMPVAFYIEKYGLGWFDISLTLIEAITKRHTGEFAIRPFLQHDPQKVLAIAQRWAQDDNFHLRRLASEGLRPRLPWAKKLTVFTANPAPVFRILTLLKSDPSAYVRRSVANNLADFLKENNAATLALLQQWQDHATQETQWIIRHALRYEIKNNNPRALKIVSS